ncbi:MAG TPA: hypothetical protein VEC60_10880 [Reyranella sp.]|nr:hypothetical protein [Reyranella sp.]
MKAILTIAAATAFLAGPAWGQAYGTVTATPQNSTGPTVPTTTDTRQVDQSLAPPTTGPNSISNPNENWRTSSGLNNDPNNPSGAPGSSSVGTSPTR